MNPYEQIISTLVGNSVEFLEIAHEPIYSSLEASKVKGILLEECAKSLLLKAKDEFVLVVLSGHKSLHSKKFKQHHGSRDLRFATPAEVKDKLGCIVGSCHPFGSVAGLKTYLDEAMLTLNNMAFNPGVHDRTIKISLNDYLNLEKPIILEVSK